jgi:predicted transcriptional regulator
MTTNEAARQRVKRLKDFGVTQAKLAAVVGKSETWISRWIDEKEGTTEISAKGLDGLRRYERALAALLSAPDVGSDLKPKESLAAFFSALIESTPQDRVPEVVAAVDHAVESLRRSWPQRSVARTVPVPKSAKRKDRSARTIS